MGDRGLSSGLGAAENSPRSQLTTQVSQGFVTNPREQRAWPTPGRTRGSTGEVCRGSTRTVVTCRNQGGPLPSWPWRNDEPGAAPRATVTVKARFIASPTPAGGNTTLPAAELAPPPVSPPTLQPLPGVGGGAGAQVRSRPSPRWDKAGRAGPSLSAVGFLGSFWLSWNHPGTGGGGQQPELGPQVKGKPDGYGKQEAGSHRRQLEQTPGAKAPVLGRCWALGHGVRPARLSPARAGPPQ